MIDAAILAAATEVATQGHHLDGCAHRRTGCCSCAMGTLRDLLGVAPRSTRCQRDGCRHAARRRSALDAARICEVDWQYEDANQRPRTEEQIIRTNQAHFDRICR